MSDNTSCVKKTSVLPIKLHRHVYALWRYGGGKRDRTADLLLARQALSQLSYTPILF